MSNQNPESEARDYWDKHLEHNPLRVHGGDTPAGAFLPWILEAAGDILRELANAPYDCGYIVEKFIRIKKNLNDKDWSGVLSSRENQDIKEIKKLLEGLPTPNLRTIRIKYLMEAIINRRSSEVKERLQHLEPLLGCDISKDKLVASTIEDEGKAIAKALEVDYTGPQYYKEDFKFHLFTDPLTGSTFSGTSLEDAKKRLKKMRDKFASSTHPLVLDRFPYPAPDQMELGGDIGKIKITIPPPRGRPAPPKKVGVTVAPEGPSVINMEGYDRDWKPKGWKLLAIGPTSTWRQDWGIWEAIRDIVQNALDEAEAYQWGYDDQGLWIADQGRGVAVADFLLGPPKLKPEYARGRYGEGMKISALVLVRNGYPVYITTVGKELWIVFLELDIDGVKSHQLNALYKAGGSSRGTKFHIIGYTGTAYGDRFAVNIPEENVLWKGPSLITKPKQRFNMLYPSHFPVQKPGGEIDPWHEKGAGAGRIFARDIYMRDINSPYSYNLWSFNLAPDRHAPVSEGDVWLDIGRLWATVKDVDLLQSFLQMVKDPPIIKSEESRNINMGPWDMGTDPLSGKGYNEIIKENAEYWWKAWKNVFGADSIIRTSEKLDNIIKHLGYQSVTLIWGVRDVLSAVINTDKVIKDISQEKLRETEVVPDEKLDSRQMAHLKLARAIVGAIFPSGSVPGVHAAIIPPASDRVRTAGMYGTSSNAIYLSLDMLFSGRSTIDTLIHEMGHHRQWRSSGEAEDLTESHAAAMTQIAAGVVERLARGEFIEYLREVSW